MSLIINAENICFSFGKKQVLNNVNVCLHEGECIAVTGGNGCGKSTLLSILAGVRRPQSGTVEVFGRTGYMPQNIALFEDMTVEENLKFFARALGERCTGEGLNKLPFSLEPLRKSRVSSLSGGMQRRVSLACAMLGFPAALLLDEPCAGLDSEWRDMVSAELLRYKSAGGAIIYVGHSREEYGAFCDHELRLKKAQP